MDGMKELPLAQYIREQGIGGAGKAAGANMIVLVTPPYCFNMTTPLKNVLDRLMLQRAAL